MLRGPQVIACRSEFLSCLELAGTVSCSIAMFTIPLGLVGAGAATAAKGFRIASSH